MTQFWRAICPYFLFHLILSKRYDITERFFIFFIWLIYIKLLVLRTAKKVFSESRDLFLMTLFVEGDLIHGKTLCILKVDLKIVILMDQG